MGTYGFSEDDAKRIGKTVRLTERFPNKVKLGGPDRGGANPGVRLLLAKHAGASWATGSTAVVTVYNGDTTAITAAGTVIAYNHYINFNATNNCANQWITLGHNGFHWYPTDAQGDCGTCISLVGGVDFRAIPGYVHTNVQFLGHESNAGCVTWYNVQTCSTAA